MQKKTIGGGALVLLILGGSIFYAARKPVPAKSPAVTEAPHMSGGVYTEHTQYYDIGANYATSTSLLSSLGTTANAQAVTVMQKFISDTVAQFKADRNFANRSAQDAKMPNLEQNRKETLKIVYLIASSPHTVSYIYTIYEDTLGAHGNTFFKTFTFDISTGAPLALADIFTPGSNYLDALSKISRTKLPNVVGTSANTAFINDGTMPKDTNFENFFFDNRDFVILFAPYAVAPYSSGPQTLRIPVSELSNILKSTYP